jgi:hypothetical protein
VCVCVCVWREGEGGGGATDRQHSGRSSEGTAQRDQILVVAHTQPPLVWCVCDERKVSGVREREMEGEKVKPTLSFTTSTHTSCMQTRTSHPHTPTASSGKRRSTTTFSAAPTTPQKLIRHFVGFRATCDLCQGARTPFSPAASLCERAVVAQHPECACVHSRMHALSPTPHLCMNGNRVRNSNSSVSLFRPH